MDRERAAVPLGEPWSGDERWYRRSFPPRRRNALTPLLHGQEYFADLCRELRAATQRVTIAGWCLTPLMSLERTSGGEGAVLAELLHEVSQRAEVCLLLWCGAPALFEPTTRYAESVQHALRAAAPRVRCELDRQARFSHDHHQKAITIDGRVAYVGGMDLTTFQGDRWDVGEHPLRFGPNWHDVQVRLEGDVVMDVQNNFCQRWSVVTGDRMQPLPSVDGDPSWDVAAQVIRTVPARFYPFAAAGEYGIRHAVLAGIRGAERFIYLENQYIWSPEVVEALCEVMNRSRSGPFRIVLVLPAKALEGRYDNDQHVRLLRAADGGRGIFHAYTLYTGGAAPGRSGYAYLPIYVHAKVAIVDDAWLTVGSANLNRRGLATDTEINVQAVDPASARRLRVRLWAEHLGMQEEDIARADPIALIDGEWKSEARQLKEAIHAAGRPPGSHVYPYEPGGAPISRALDLLQELTLEH